MVSTYSKRKPLRDNLVNLVYVMHILPVITCPTKKRHHKPNEIANVFYRMHFAGLAGFHRTRVDETKSVNIFSFFF